MTRIYVYLATGGGKSTGTNRDPTFCICRKIERKSTETGISGVKSQESIIKQ